MLGCNHNFAKMWLLIWTEYSGEQYDPLGPLLLFIFVVGLSEPRAQRYSDRYSSIVRRILWNKLFIFLSSPKTTKPISTKLGTKHPELMGIRKTSQIFKRDGIKNNFKNLHFIYYFGQVVELLVNISQMGDVAHESLVRFR